MESRRPYRSDLRTAQAADTRARILVAAATEFARRGYAGTTIPVIAATAGVSPETVKAHGAKHELLLAAFEYRFAGREGSGPIAEDADVRADLDVLPEAETVAYFAATATRFNERGAGLWSAFSTAARSDEAVATVYHEITARRLEDFALAVDLFRERGFVTSSASRERLAAELAHLASPEGYQLLVDDFGWTVEDYREWLTDAVLRAVSAESPSSLRMRSRMAASSG